jgi:hypothetical protein
MLTTHHCSAASSGGSGTSSKSSERICGFCGHHITEVVCVISEAIPKGVADINHVVVPVLPAHIQSEQEIVVYISCAKYLQQINAINE